ncbi:MAG TPA: D-alanine--D-alanine ligase [Armatimonadota bacterium]|jgi:D-alanine-D-alanine ligase
MEIIRVAVLMGGISSEREVSLRSGANVANALDREKYAVRTLDFTGDVGPIVALKDQVDVAFLALHGFGGEDGRMQGLLDLLEIPYTGSGVLGSAMAMHKGVAKQLYGLAGIPTPTSITLQAGEEDSALNRQTRLVRDRVGVPCVVKPANEGSTIGISIVRTAKELEDALADAFLYDTEVVVEAFVEGVEISVPVLGTLAPQPLPEVEIVPQSGFYDYEMKYTPGMTEEICPARISDVARAAAADYAVRAHRVLHCKGVSRTDMIVTGDEVTVLETNTLPGLTDTSLLPLSARHVGMSFADLLDVLIADALGQDLA